ncbi:MAG: hypothetical protein QM640_03730 [Niabella sp.]
MILRLSLISMLISCVCHAQNKKHVLLVSIDGFRPDFYKQELWTAPVLQRLKAGGVYADGPFF